LGQEKRRQKLKGGNFLRRNPLLKIKWPHDGLGCSGDGGGGWGGGGGGGGVWVLVVGCVGGGGGGGVCCGVVFFLFSKRARKRGAKVKNGAVTDESKSKRAANSYVCLVESRTRFEGKGNSRYQMERGRRIHGRKGREQKEKGRGAV